MRALITFRVSKEILERLSETDRVILEELVNDAFESTLGFSVGLFYSWVEDSRVEVFEILYEDGDDGVVLPVSDVSCDVAFAVATLPADLYFRVAPVTIFFSSRNGEQIIVVGEKVAA